MPKVITNKQDLFLWLKELDININLDKIPEVMPHSKPLRNKKWKEIDTDLSDTEYLFKPKEEEHYSINKCVIWMEENDTQIKLFLVRGSPKFTRYGKIKPRFINITKKKELLSSKNKFEEYFKLLFSDFDFKYDD